MTQFCLAPLTQISTQDLSRPNPLIKTEHPWPHPPLLAPPTYKRDIILIGPVLPGMFIPDRNSSPSPSQSSTLNTSNRERPSPQWPPFLSRSAGPAHLLKTLPQCFSYSPGTWHSFFHWLLSTFPHPPFCPLGFALYLVAQTFPFPVLICAPTTLPPSPPTHTLFVQKNKLECSHCLLCIAPPTSPGPL